MNNNFIIFSLTRWGIEPRSTDSVTDALSTRPLKRFCILDKALEGVLIKFHIQDVNLFEAKTAGLRKSQNRFISHTLLLKGLKHPANSCSLQ